MKHTVTTNVHYFRSLHISIVQLTEYLHNTLFFDESTIKENNITHLNTII